MKFVDLDFHNKSEVREDTRKKILLACKESIPMFNKFNTFRVDDYLNLLIEETPYNPHRHYFYDEDTGVKISLKVFKAVAIEYLLEHIDDFLLEKHKKLNIT